jgi:putative transposase
MMAALSRLFNWRGAHVAVQADTLVRWHRKGFRLFWRWKSKPKTSLAQELPGVDPENVS